MSTKKVARSPRLLRKHAAKKSEPVGRGARKPTVQEIAKAAKYIVARRLSATTSAHEDLMSATHKLKRLIFSMLTGATTGADPAQCFASIVSTFGDMDNAIMMIGAVIAMDQREHEDRS